jgi:hypothetical protein
MRPDKPIVAQELVLQLTLVREDEPDRSAVCIFSGKELTSVEASKLGSALQRTVYEMLERLVG